MPTNFNAASRAYVILTKAAQQGNNIPTLQVWATIFGLPTDDPISRMFEIAYMVEQLYKQLTQVRSLLATQRISPEKYNPVIDRLQNALLLDGPGNPWGSYQQHLHTFTLDMLAQYADLIDTEGEPIPQEELKKLDQLLDELEKQINIGNLSVEAQRFIKQHIEILRKAFRLYLVSGNEAFTEAVSQAITTVAINKEIINKHSDNPEFQTAIQRLNEAWAAIKDFSPDIQTVLALMQGGQLLLEGGKIATALLTGG